MEASVGDQTAQVQDPEFPLSVKVAAWVMIIWAVLGLVANIALSVGTRGPLFVGWAAQHAILGSLCLAANLAVAIVPPLYALKGRLWAYYATIGVAVLVGVSSAVEALKQTPRLRSWDLDLTWPVVTIVLLLLGRKSYLRFVRSHSGQGHPEPSGPG